MKAKVQQQGAAAIKKGSWSPEEDAKLVHIVQEYGHAHWNSLAHAAGLQRTGKSCRLRWMNYLRPNVRHGRFSLEEQLLILQLHCRWGNRWAKIAEQLPGRTDNDIKNYWRTRILKHAEHLKCDANSPLFKHAIHHIWIPTLLERIMSGSGSGSGSGSESGSDYISLNHLPINSPQDVIGPQNINVLELPNGPANPGTENPNISNGTTGPLEVHNGAMGFERAQDSQRGIRNEPEFESWVFESSPSELELVLDDIMFHSDQHSYFDSNPMTSI